MSESDALQPLFVEASRVEEDSLFSARGHFEASRSWSKTHFSLGLPTAVIAGLSGVSALQDAPLLAGGLAIIAAALASVMTFVNPSERAAAHHATGTKFNSLRNRARIYREIDLPGPLSLGEKTEQLRTLSQERDDANETSPQITRRAFQRAREGIEAGEARHAIDEEPAS